MSGDHHILLIKASKFCYTVYSYNFLPLLSTQYQRKLQDDFSVARIEFNSKWINMLVICVEMTFYAGEKLKIVCTNQQGVD